MTFDEVTFDEVIFDEVINARSDDDSPNKQFLLINKIWEIFSTNISLILLNSKTILELLKKAMNPTPNNSAQIMSNKC